MNQIFNQLRCQFYPEEILDPAVHAHKLKRTIAELGYNDNCEICQDYIVDSIYFECTECNWCCHLHCAPAPATNSDIKKEINERMNAFDEKFEKLQELLQKVLNSSSSGTGTGTIVSPNT